MTDQMHKSSEKSPDVVEAAPAEKAGKKRVIAMIDGVPTYPRRVTETKRDTGDPMTEEHIRQLAKK